MCNDTTRLTDRRSRNRAAKALREVVAAKGQRGAARILKINPGTVNHIIANTDQSWTHVTLDRLLLSCVELAAEYVKHDTDINAEIERRFEIAMERSNELAAAMRDLRKEIRKL